MNTHNKFSVMYKITQKAQHTREDLRKRLLIGPFRVGLMLCFRRKLSGRCMSAGNDKRLLMSCTALSNLSYSITLQIHSKITKYSFRSLSNGYKQAYFSRQPG